QPQRMLDQLKQAAEPKPIDPALPMKLASAKLELDTSLADHDRSPEWWSDAASYGLVQAGLNAVTRWLSEKLVDRHGDATSNSSFRRERNSDGISRRHVG